MQQQTHNVFSKNKKILQFAVFFLWFLWYNICRIKKEIGMHEKYLSVKKTINGYSFANMGIFMGLAAGVYGASYSLVLLELLNGNSALVSIYVALYSFFCLLVSLIPNEVLKYFTKSQVFHFSLLVAGIGFCMMGLSIKVGTFIALDYMTGLAAVFTGVLTPLFMSDFSTKKTGITELRSRFNVWANIGIFAGPMLAMYIAERFGDNYRLGFVIAGICYLICWMDFRYFRIVQADKKKMTPNAKRNFKSLMRSIKVFFSKHKLRMSYINSICYFILVSIRALYVPIVMVERGFSPTQLGIVLSIGVLPYIFSNMFVVTLIRRFGKRALMNFGLITFGLFALWAVFASNFMLPIIFILWQVSAAIMAPVRDLSFFDAVKKSERPKFLGIYTTANTLSKFIAPLMCAGIIFLFRDTYFVWLFAVFACLVSLYIYNFKK